MKYGTTYEFEAYLRNLADKAFERPVNEPQNPIAQLIQRKLPLAECRELYTTMWPSLMVFNRVLLTRLIETAPSLELRCEILEVIAPEFGRRLCDAHPVFFKSFLESLGVTHDPRWNFDLETGPGKDEAKMMRNATFCELVARILVGETIGPKVFETVAEALHDSYKIPYKSLAYFLVHAKHDKRDTQVLFNLLSRAADTEEKRQKAVDMMNWSYSGGRYIMYACNLPGRANYIFSDLIEHSPMLKAA